MSARECSPETLGQAKEKVDDGPTETLCAPGGEPAVESPPEHLQIGRSQLVVIIAALFLSLFLAALDFTIVSPALPTISHYFHSASGYTWIGSSYLLSNAASSPIWGKCSDIWGRKLVLLAAVFVFFVGSLVCATSNSIGMLIAGRAVQGSAAGGVVILVNISISDLFDVRERGLYLGLTGIVWALASGVGPVMGGAFTQKLSWRWSWWINLPCSGVAFVVLLVFLKVRNQRMAYVEGFKRVDWFGSFSILGVTVMFLLGLNFGGISFPWDSPKVICLIVFGLAMIALFILSETKLATYPLIPMRLFKMQSNVAALLVCFCHGFTYISASYFLPLYFQSVGGVSALRSGILILPVALVQSFSGIVSGYIIRKTGRYLELIWVGMIFLVLGFGLFIDLDGDFSLGKVVGFEIIAGVGIGLLFQSPLIALQSNTLPEDLATATATFGFVRNLATSMSVVIGGVVFQNGMARQNGMLREHLGAAMADKLSGGSAGANVGLLASLSAEQRAVACNAFAHSLQDLWILYTCMAGVGAIVSLCISKKTLSASPATVPPRDLKDPCIENGEVDMELGPVNRSSQQ